MVGLSITSGVGAIVTIVGSLGSLPSIDCVTSIWLPAVWVGIEILKFPFASSLPLTVFPFGNVIVISAFGSAFPVTSVEES